MRARCSCGWQSYRSSRKLRSVSCAHHHAPSLEMHRSVRSRHARQPSSFWGAGRATNNTAELTALLEALVYLRDVEGTTAPAIVRPDSEYAMDLALGRSRRDR